MTPGAAGPARSWGFSQSACRPCEPLAHQISRNRFSGRPALADSALACLSTVSVTGAFLAFRSCSQSDQTCSWTSSGRATAAAGALFFLAVLLTVLDGSLRLGGMWCRVGGTSCRVGGTWCRVNSAPPAGLLNPAPHAGGISCRVNSARGAGLGLTVYLFDVRPLDPSQTMCPVDSSSRTAFRTALSERQVHSQIARMDGQHSLDSLAKSASAISTAFCVGGSWMGLQAVVSACDTQANSSADFRAGSNFTAA